VTIKANKRNDFEREKREKILRRSNFEAID